MSNLNLILQDMLWIYLIAISIGIYLVILFNKKRIITSIIVLNWAPIVGLAVMIYIFIFSKTVYKSELLLLVIVIEFVLLFIVTFLLQDLLVKIKQNIHLYSSSNILIKLLCISNVIVIYLIASNPTSMGIFSEGSRIDYLSSGTLPLLLTYLSMVIQTSIMVSIGARVYVGKLSKLDFFAIFSSFVGSLLAGSKGAIFLSIVYMIVIAWGLGHHFSRWLKILVPLVALPLVGVYTFILTQFLNTTFIQNINMAISRFVLSADGRALASDYQIRDALMENIHGSLLSEIFKAFAPRLGFIVSDIPLGVAQYAAAFNIQAYVGANAGISSLILSYYDNYMDIFSIFICLLFTIIVIAVGYLTLRESRTPFQQLMTIAFIITSLLTFVQDYHAFELTAALLFLWTVYIFARGIIIAPFSYKPRKHFN